MSPELRRCSSIVKRVYQVYMDLVCFLGTAGWDFVGHWSWPAISSLFTRGELVILLALLLARLASWVSSQVRQASGWVQRKGQQLPTAVAGGGTLSASAIWQVQPLQGARSPFFIPLSLVAPPVFSELNDLAWFVSSLPNVGKCSRRTETPRIIVQMKEGG